MNKPEPEIPKRLMNNPRTQIVLFILAVIYILSPIDFIPDAIPVIGWFDDITVFFAELISFMLYLKQKRQKMEGKKDGNQENSSQT
ncbi:MAG: YkvA family protein [Candidatus Rifleibacteriota bacterium]